MQPTRRTLLGREPGRSRRRGYVGDGRRCSAVFGVTIGQGAAAAQIHRRLVLPGFGLQRSRLVSQRRLAVLPDFLITGHIAAGSLICVLPEWSLPVGGIHVVYPAARFRPRRVTAFVTMLVSMFKEPVRDSGGYAPSSRSFSGSAGDPESRHFQPMMPHGWFCIQDWCTTSTMSGGTARWCGSRCGRAAPLPLSPARLQTPG